MLGCYEDIFLLLFPLDGLHHSSFLLIFGNFLTIFAPKGHGCNRFFARSFIKNLKNEIDGYLLHTVICKSMV